MILYHFTSPLHIDSIRAQGLTRGVVLASIRPLGFLPCCQWLTKNPEFQQSWCLKQYSTLSYDRSAFRITVEIPDDDPRLFTWHEVTKALPLDVVFSLNSHGDHENWYIYRGIVLPKWFTSVCRAPKT